MARAGSETHVSVEWARRFPGVAWKLVTQTVGTCLRYRVTGLAAEAAFFAILSLPPLIFGLAGSIGFIASQYFEVETIDDIKLQIAALAGRALTAESVTDVIVPTLNQVLDGGRPDVISIGFVLALWSGSRALNVFVDTITIMYGMGGRRGIIRTRALSFSLYCVALIIGVIVLPLVLAGPSAIDYLLPQRLDFLNQLYWPVVTILSAGFLNTLYHLSVPIRTPWVSDLPGSFLALSIWILGSFVLRWTLQTTVGGTSIYGPLAAPIAVLLWLYLTAIAVLIGAALNAVVDRMWPNQARKDRLAAQEEQEPVMKAESEQEAGVAAGVAVHPERSEVKLARAVEALGDSSRDKASAAASRPESAPSESAPSESAPSESAPSGIAQPETAADTAKSETSQSETAQSETAQAASPRSGTTAPGTEPPGVRQAEHDRKPASVGKPGARADSDDIR
jgi:membrane protein